MISSISASTGSWWAPLELLEALGQPTMKAIEAGRAHSRGAAVTASQ